MTNNEIAQKLFISSTTVDTHRKSLLNKFSAKNTASLDQDSGTHEVYLSHNIPSFDETPVSLVFKPASYNALVLSENQLQ